MTRRFALIAALLVGVSAGLAALPGAGTAQPYDYDDRPPPPPDDGYRRPPPPPRFADDDDDDAPLMCRTPEGSCRGHGPRFYRARCFCDFGDGPVRGRMR